MTIKPEVLAAMDQATATYDNLRFERRADPTICAFWTTRIAQMHNARAELLAMDAEIDQIKSAWEKQIRHSSQLSQIAQDAQQGLTQAESRLAEADALLREVLRLNYTVAPDLAYRITNYLQGSSDETL